MSSDNLIRLDVGPKNITAHSSLKVESMTLYILEFVLAHYRRAYDVLETFRQLNFPVWVAVCAEPIMMGFKCSPSVNIEFDQATIAYNGQVCLKYKAGRRDVVVYYMLDELEAFAAASNVARAASPQL